MNKGDEFAIEDYVSSHLKVRNGGAANVAQCLGTCLPYVRPSKTHTNTYTERSRLKKEFMYLQKVRYIHCPVTLEEN